MEEARELLADMLTHLGARADAVSSGALALKAVAQADEIGDPYELLLTDWLMPGLNGTQTWQQICGLPLKHRPACILVSGSLSCPADELDAGPFAAFLPKPVLPKALQEVLARVWGQSQARDTVQNASPAPARFAPGMRLLLAEDNALNQEVAGELLRQLGFAVEMAGDGLIAIEQARRQRYDLILMDVQMPHMDGLEATRQIRALPGYEHTPIVAMTANAFAEDRAAALGAGMNDHLPKPVDPEQLRRVLAQQLPHAVQTADPPTPSARPATTMDNEAELRSKLEAIDGMDLTQGLRSLGNNFAALVRLLHRITVQHTQDAQQALHALRTGDLEEAQRILHTLKGLAGTAGLPGLQVAAQRAEAVVEASRSRPGTDTSSPLMEVSELLARLACSFDFLPNDTHPSTTALDQRGLQAALLRLRPLLASDDIDASAAYADLHMAMLKHYPQQAQALAQTIDDFDFVQALHLLDTIMASASSPLDALPASDTP
ncbi:response regulator receiver domain-containing protein [Acidovorax sp. 69]|nr:response regulator receiver domain-containing protein [Acidovorax sp. 69]